LWLSAVKTVADSAPYAENVRRKNHFTSSSGAGMTTPAGTRPGLSGAKASQPMPLAVKATRIPTAETMYRSWSSATARIPLQATTNGTAVRPTMSA